MSRTLICMTLVFALVLGGCTGNQATPAAENTPAENTPIPTAKPAPPTATSAPTAADTQQTATSEARSVSETAPAASTASQPSSGTSSSQEPVDSAAHLDELMQAVGEIRTQIDRTLFDLDALSLALGFEPATIISFVQDEIAYEPYPGLLRGPQGTLMSRAGNDLDQAALLRQLLEDAGFEVRLARARLSPEQAADLLAQIPESRAEPPEFGDLDAMIQALAATAGQAASAEFTMAIAQATKPTPFEAQPVHQEITAQQDTLLALLQKEGHDLSSTSLEEILAADASDYTWVEYRLGPSDAWIPAHPAFGDALAWLDALDAEEVIEGPIPDAWHQRIRIQAFVERTVDEEAEIVPLFEPWEAASADLLGRPISYRNHPDTVHGPEDLLEMGQRMTAAQAFVPLLDDLPPTGAVAFDIYGNILSLAEVAPGEFDAAPIARSLSSLGGGISGSLTGTPAQQTALLAHWLDVTLLLPDGTEISRRKLLYRAEETGAEADDPYQRGAALTALHLLMLDAGRYADGYVLDRTLNLLEIQANLLQSMVQQPDTISSAVLENLPPPDTADATSINHLVLFSAFDAGAWPAEGISYRWAPAIVAYSESLREAGLNRQIDILHSPRRTLAQTDAGIRSVWSATSAAGIWETFTEGQILDVEGTGYGAATILSEARAAGAEMTLLRSGDEIPAWGLEASVAERVDGELAAGYLVVLPRPSAASPTSVAWWRLDPVTGQTTGVLADGSGGYRWQGSNEYQLKLMVGIGVGVYAFFMCSLTAPLFTGNTGSAEFNACIKFGSNVASGGKGVLSFIGAIFSLFLDLLRSVLGQIVP